MSDLDALARLFGKSTDSLAADLLRADDEGPLVPTAEDLAGFEQDMREGFGMPEPMTDAELDLMALAYDA